MEPFKHAVRLPCGVLCRSLLGLETEGGLDELPHLMDGMKGGFNLGIGRKERHCFSVEAWAAGSAIVF
jgi:hypothetical protein